MRLLLLAVLSAHAALASAEPVKASWKQAFYNGPNYRRYDCVPALEALDDMLNAISARKVRKGCSWNYGLTADWEALTPSQAAAQRARVAALTGKEEFLLKDKDGNVINAHWQAVRLQRSLSDVRACDIYSQALDYLLDVLPVRKGSLSVFCDSGTSFISVSFDALVADEAASASRGLSRR